MLKKILAAVAASMLPASIVLSGPAPRYDLVIRNGLILDGGGGEPFSGSVAVNGDTIAAVGALPDARGSVELDAAGLAVTPGFINMLSWANESLIQDGRSQSDIRQGVTLEVLGEGNSMGPLSEAMKRDRRGRQDDAKYDIGWTTLGEYLHWLTRRGISPNVTSFVGATTVRIHEIGFENRRANARELERMCRLVDQAMREGAVGVSSALIYSPGAYADQAELTALARVVARYDGLYISHIRGEGDHLLEAWDEFLGIIRDAGARGEIYHLKAGAGNWHKFDELLRRIESARAEGLKITADMYTYNASGTGLDAIMPPWVQEGGQKAWVERLGKPEIRARLRQEMDLPGARDSGSVEAARRVMLTSFRTEKLRPLIGKTLADVAALRRVSPEEAAMDLVIEDNSRVGVVIFGMSEENVRKGLCRPWVSFCSDAGSLTAEGAVLRQSTHPRAYGSFARMLGRYVRDEKLVSLPEAIRRMTSLPATNLRIERRGRLAPGCFADIVILDPATIQDHATFEKPHQYATGVRDVFVNGVPVLRGGEHTGARPGRVVCGPGYRKP
jgi:N-acyl-D-amino-acid deacylase